jgi:RHS repeat-associated protein
VRPTQSWRYEHDDAGRLVAAARGPMDAAWNIETPVESRGYVYDAVGDALQTTGDGATSFTYDALHQVLTAGEAELLHDEAGRLTGDDLHRYEYDAKARLVRAVRKGDGGEALGIAYNALGERVLTRVDGVETEHVTHGGMVLEEREGHGEVARRFVYGASARDPLLLESGAGSFSVLQDRLGSLVGLVDAAGSLVERAEYGPYGAMTLFDGAGAPLSGSGLGNPFGFTGQRFDPSVGWLHFRFRSYAPTLMRFVTRDPAGYVAGGNLYEYALSNPVDIVDPHGDCPPVLLGALIGANAAMWLYNMQHACGNPLFGSSYVGTDWNGYEQLKVGAAGAAAGATGAASFGATASVLSAGGMGALETYVTAGVVSSAGAKVAEDIVMDKETTIDDLRDAAIYGGATGGLGYGLGRIGSSLKLLNAVEDISPKAAAALSEEVLNPLTTKVGYAGRINSESQLLKNLVSTETKGGVQTSAALKGDIDMWSSRQMTQLERVDLASSINKNAGAALIDAHPTHGVLSEMTPANLVVDEIATAQALGKLQYKVIPTKQLFEEGAIIVKPSTGATRFIDPRQVLEIHNPMPTLGAFMLPLGPVLVE